MTIPDPILPLPIPQRGEDKDDFNAKMNAFVSGLSSDAIPGINEAVEFVNESVISTENSESSASVSASTATASAVEANESVISTKKSELSASASASAALISADKAAAGGNFKGYWTEQAGAATVPATYSHNNKDWRLARDLADITLSEPSNSNNDYSALTGSFNPNVLQNSHFYQPSPIGLIVPIGGADFNAGDEVFLNWKVSVGGIIGLSRNPANGNINRTSGSIYQDVPKSGPLGEYTGALVASWGDNAGVSTEDGAVISFLDMGDYYRVTLTPNGCFSAKLEQGVIASKHEATSGNKLEFSVRTFDDMVSTNYPVGSIVSVKKRKDGHNIHGGTWEIVAGATANGIDVIDDGIGNQFSFIYDHGVNVGTLGALSGETSTVNNPIVKHVMENSPVTTVFVTEAVLIKDLNITGAIDKKITGGGSFKKEDDISTNKLISFTNCPNLTLDIWLDFNADNSAVPTSQIDPASLFTSCNFIVFGDNFKCVNGGATPSRYMIRLNSCEDSSGTFRAYGAGAYALKIAGGSHRPTLKFIANDNGLGDAGGRQLDIEAALGAASTAPNAIANPVITANITSVSTPMQITGGVHSGTYTGAFTNLSTDTVSATAFKFDRVGEANKLTGATLKAEAIGVNDQNDGTGFPVTIETCDIYAINPLNGQGIRAGGRSSNFNLTGSFYNSNRIWQANTGYLIDAAASDTTISGGMIRARTPIRAYTAGQNVTRLKILNVDMISTFEYCVFGRFNGLTIIGGTMAGHSSDAVRALENATNMFISGVAMLNGNATDRVTSAAATNLTAGGYLVNNPGMRSANFPVPSNTVVLLDVPI